MDLDDDERQLVALTRHLRVLRQRLAWAKRRAARTEIDDLAERVQRAENLTARHLADLTAPRR